MNWDAIGAIGEIFGAIAVVVSLVYLGRQINQSARTTSIQIEQTEAQSLIDQMNTLVQNTDLGMDISPGDMTDEVAMKRTAFWFSWFTNASFKHKYSTEENLVDLERLYGQYIAYWFRNHEHFPIWWEFSSSNFPKDFVDWVDEHDEGSA